MFNLHLLDIAMLPLFKKKTGMVGTTQISWRPCPKAIRHAVSIFFSFSLFQTLLFVLPTKVNNKCHSIGYTPSPCSFFLSVSYSVVFSLLLSFFWVFLCSFVLFCFSRSIGFYCLSVGVARLVRPHSRRCVRLVSPVFYRESVPLFVSFPSTVIPYSLLLRPPSPHCHLGLSSSSSLSCCCCCCCCFSFSFLFSFLGTLVCFFFVLSCLTCVLVPSGATVTTQWGHATTTHAFA